MTSKYLSDPNSQPYDPHNQPPDPLEEPASKVQKLEASRSPCIVLRIRGKRGRPKKYAAESSKESKADIFTKFVLKKRNRVNVVHKPP